MKTNFNETTRHKLSSRAKDRLIFQKHCSRTKDKDHTVACLGKDLNILDNARSWIYDEERQKGTELEQARIYANKAVLYVNQAELDQAVQQIYMELVEQAKSGFESKKVSYSEKELQAAIAQMLA